jgi:hypothetical protein
MEGKLVYQDKVKNAQCSILDSQFSEGVYVIANDGRSVKAIVVD